MSDFKNGHSLPQTPPPFPLHFPYLCKTLFHWLMAIPINLSTERGRTLLDAVDSALSLPIAEGYQALSLILNSALTEGTQGANILFSSPFARMDYLCREINYPQANRAFLNATRDRLRRANELTETEQQRTIAENALCIAEFIAAICQISLPHELNEKLPQKHIPLAQHHAFSESVRMVVTRWDNDFAYGEIDNEGYAKLRYNTENRFGVWGYLNQLFFEGMQLSLVRPARGNDGTITADLILCLPDLLINITDITRCLRPVSISPLWYLKDLFTPSPSSIPILLGNFSGQLLDARLHQKDNALTDYRENVKRFFQHNALKIAQQYNEVKKTNFHTQGRFQLANIDSIVTNQLPDLQGYNLEKVVLEPTLLCDTLGLQGRTDLLQSDYRVLIEQKSGKCDEWLTQQHPDRLLQYKTDHFAQLLLYQAMLRYGLHVPNDRVSGALLYSKYPNGLVRTGPAPKLLGQCIKIRNRIAHLDYALAHEDVESMFNRISVDSFNPNNSTSTLWTEYTRPEVEAFVDTLRSAPPLARAYFFRFVAFISRERLLGRIGAPQRQIDGFASIWCASLHEKHEAGSILYDLAVGSLTPAAEDNGVAKVTFIVPQHLRDSNTNFRTGDIVVLHAYSINATPSATAGMIFRGTIETLSPQQVTVTLRAPQRNMAIFAGNPSQRWAIEHDRYDSSEKLQLQSLFSLLTTTQDRRNLLLAGRPPRTDSTRTLRLDHTLPNGNEEFNNLALRAKQALDFFLVVGPPGTGKTSFGLMCILREELATPSANVLLLSFTNRAVDEICSKLEKDNISYLRVGSLFGCGESYRQRLLREATKGCRNVDDAVDLISKTRVFIGTTASLLNAPELLQLKSFSLAIIDEASQILEPNLLGLLCATRNAEEPAIQRFVLIGDHRQLPAVVMQPKRDSAVTDPILQAIGLNDCRESLFERLYRLHHCDPRFAYQLTRQGRMHPDVSDFANRYFYGNKLSPVPLPHQTTSLKLLSPSPSPLHSLLCAHRTLFFNVPSPHDSSHTCNGKSNPAEAAAITHIVKAILEIYQHCRSPFAPAQQIGVIVPYRNQITQVRLALRATAASNIPGDTLEAITVDTVERYQGSERDVIIYGLTLQHLFQLDFLTDSRTTIEEQLVDRKLNVALTRAREQMIIVGNAALARHDALYARLVEDYSSRDEVIEWGRYAG